jgi:hypothetical protein
MLVDGAFVSLLKGREKPNWKSPGSCFLRGSKATSIISLHASLAPKGNPYTRVGSTTF